LTYTKREPIGVVGAIIPWNAPIAMAILKIAPSLAAGCTIILKPAELAPLTSMKLADIAKEAGVPDGVFNVVNGTGPEVGAALSEHMNIQKVSFTGSTGVGQTIAKAAAGSNLKKVTLELGGKSPVVVFPDANMEKVIPSICRAAFFLQGQNCMAGTRLLVHKDVADAVIEGVVAALAFWKVGDGFQPDTLIGPLISATQRDRVMSFIEAGKAEGARLVTGGNAVGEKGYFVEPTVFADCKPDMTIVQEEIFGPVLSVLTFDTYDLDEIAQLANDNIYGLSGSVWTQDISRAHKLVSMIDSGQVSINCHAAVDPAIPFGGNKMSGWGREFGKEGLEPFLKTKATTVVF
jgi:phenylacetaldehyde dehydrogenase